MAIKALLDSVDDIPEAMKDLYVEDNGKFVLDVEDFDLHPKVRGVVTANRENVKKRDNYKKQVDDLTAKLSVYPEDFDPDEYLTLKSQVDPNDPEAKKKREEHLQAARQQYEAKIKAIQDQNAAALAAKDAEIAEREGFIDKSVRIAGLRDALTEVGVESDLLEGALASLLPSVKVLRSDDGNRKPIVETDLGEIEVQGFVKDWAASKGKAYLRKPSGPSAGGNNGRHNAGAKTISRKDWDGMSQPERMAKSKDGYRVTDGA